MAERPNKDASRAEWDDYAKTLDLDPEDYQNKEALIEAVEAELLLRDDDDDDAEDDDTPTAEDVEVPKKGKYPEEYKDASDSWKAAYDHAVSHGNPEKTAIIYANQHLHDEEFGG